MIHGIVDVLKPSAMSSHDVVGRVRHIFGMKKVGHAGTLDPLAAGVLPVFLGQATRLIEYRPLASTGLRLINWHGKTRNSSCLTGTFTLMT